MDNEKEMPSRRQAVTEETPAIVAPAPVAPPDVPLLGAPHALRATPAECPEINATLDAIHEQKITAVLNALDDPRVIAKLAQVFVKFEELRPDGFRTPTRWQQRSGR